jgi:hypothetical protein
LVSVTSVSSPSFTVIFTGSVTDTPVAPSSGAVIFAAGAFSPDPPFPPSPESDVHAVSRTTLASRAATAPNNRWDLTWKNLHCSVCS